MIYEIYNDDDLIYSNGLPLEECKILSPSFSMELGKAGELTFVAPPLGLVYESADVNYVETRYRLLTSTISIKRNGVLVWTGRALHEEKDFYGNKSVYCEGRLAWLNDTTIFPYSYGFGKRLRNDGSGDPRIHPSKQTAGYILQRFIVQNNHRQLDLTTANGQDKNLTLGNVYNPNVFNEENGNRIAKTYAIEGDEYNNFLSEINDKFCNNEELGGYFSIRYGTGINEGTAYLDYLGFDPTENDRGYHEVDQVIRFGENLLDLADYVDTSEIYTLVTPVGAYTTNYICSLDYDENNPDLPEDRYMVNVINDASKKATLWKHLASKHPTKAAEFLTSIGHSGSVNPDVPPTGEDSENFINDYFSDSEQGPRLSIASVNRAVDPATSEMTSYEYIPTPNLWSSDTYIKKYGLISRVIVYDDVDDPATLKTLGQKDRQQLSLINTITITAADLAGAGYDCDSIWLGDVVPIDTYVHGIYDKRQCKQIAINFDNLANTTFTFGAVYGGLTDKELKVAKQTGKNQKDISENASSISSITAIDSNTGGGLKYAQMSDLLRLQNQVNARFDGLAVLPSVSATDNGKILKVVNGAWQLANDETAPAT